MRDGETGCTLEQAHPVGSPVASDNSSKKHRKPSALDPTARKQEEQQEQEQQVEVGTEVARDTQQEQLGNQGVAAMLGMPSVAPGSAGLNTELVDRGHDHESDFQFGGDDDAPADGPTTLRDLVREWNKGTQRGRDITSFADPMPEEALPPADGALAARIRAAPAPDDLPASDTLDPLLQPTASVLGGDLGPWLREALRWADDDLAARALQHLIVPTAGALQDPSGRVLFGRARAATLATLLVLDGPALRDGPPPATSAFVDLCLELAGQRPTLLQVWWRAQQAQLTLPVGAEIARRELTDRRNGLGRGARADDDAAARIEAVLRDLLDLPSAVTLVPHLPTVEPHRPDDDDPLGLDDVLASHTGGRPDPLESLYATCQLGAERLASAVARTRVRLAGLAVALAEVGDQWIAGAPLDASLALVEHADSESQRVLALLVEITQAARRRAVEPPGIRNGLRRAARMLDKVVTSLVRSFVRLVAGLLPEAPGPLPPVPPPADDPLAGAWGDGTPRDALPWLAQQPEGWSRDVAVALTRLGAGAAPSALAGPLLVLADAAPASRWALAEALRTVAGSCLLWAGDDDGALALGRSQRLRGRARRHGLLMASGTLLALEVLRRRDDEAAVDALRLQCGVDAWHMGQRAAVQLMLCWTPPPVDDLDEAFDAAFA